MDRKVLVFGTDEVSQMSIIEALTNGSGFHGKRLQKNSDELFTIGECDYHGQHYIFVTLPRLSVKDSDDLRTKNLHVYTKLSMDQVGSIHCILFIASESNLSLSLFHQVRSIVYSRFNQMIPMGLVIGNITNDKIFSTENEFLMILKESCIPLIKIPRSDREKEFSNAIARLWNVLEQLPEVPLTASYDTNDTKERKRPSEVPANQFRVAADGMKGTNYENKSHDVKNTRNDHDHSMKEDLDKWKKMNIPQLFANHNTDLNMIKKRISKLNCFDNQFNCVLITTGSMNPVHRSHLGNLELVREHLERQNPAWNVLAGYVSPTHDKYVRGKLGKSAIPGRDRCDLCELAIDEHQRSENVPKWLQVSRAESEYPGGFVDFGPVTQALASFLNLNLFIDDRFTEHPIHVIYVCGLDHFNKCPDVEYLAKQLTIKSAVIFRLGSDENLIRRLDPSSNIIYVPLDHERESLIDISSTAIRNCMGKSKREVEKYTYRSVAEHLRNLGYLN